MISDIQQLVPKGFEWSVGQFTGGWKLSIWEPNAKYDMKVCSACRTVINISKQSKYRRGCYVTGTSLEEVIRLAKEKLGVIGV